ncbi:E3 ubiquitin-protein ligase ATL6-like [Tasmannia lanceolata]|uniref:E3 ubiquitin-protein ligase ATL6-like n=1 Tax=Tasmannia lanceolata TaxID=3420 RepID=UPI0040636F53
MTKQKKTNHSRPIIHLHFIIFLLLASLAVAQPNNPPPTPNPNSNPFNTQFNPSTAIIIVVLTTALFFIGFFSIYIRQCSGDQSVRAGGLNAGPRGRSRRAAARGLDRTVIETFPTFEYSVVKDLKLGKGTLECAVCLSEFEDDETLRLLPKCNHVFHPDCIDAWLSSHTTCPVCRFNLTPGSIAAEESIDPDETVSESENHEHEVVIEIEEDRDHQDPQPNIIDLPRILSQNRPQPEIIDPAQIQIKNRPPRQPEVIGPGQIPIQNRPPRSGSSRRPRRFLRSHSTGHSLIQPGENVDRFTLRLPEHVRREIVKGKKLNRTISCVDFQAERDGSSRRGGGGEGSSRGRNIGRSDRRSNSDRWGLSVATGFFARTFSVKSPKTAADGDLTVTTPKALLQSVKAPFQCLGAKAEADEESSAAAAVPVFTVSHQAAG